MNDELSRIEKALRGVTGKTGASAGTPDAPAAKPGGGEAEATPEAAPIARPAQENGLSERGDQLAVELTRLMLGKKLPPDFSLQEALADKDFIQLLAQLPAYAAVRVYAAERRAEESEQTARARMTEALELYARHMTEEKENAQ